MREQVGPDSVADAEPGRAGADRLDHAGHVDPRDAVPGREQADADTGDHWPAPEVIEVGGVQGCRADSHEHLTRAGHRAFDVGESDDLTRRSVAIAHDRPHQRGG